MNDVRSTVTVDAGREPAISRPREERSLSGVRSAQLMARLVVVSLFADYYGGFGVKYLVFVIALIWIAGRHKAIASLREIRRDIIALIVIPILFIGLHVVDNVLFAQQAVDWGTYLSRSYSTISAAVFILLYPLFRRAGSATVLRWMVVGFRVTAAFVIFVFTLNWFGIIDVRDFQDFTMNYRVGVYGIDGRVIDPLADTGQKVHAYPFVAHAMPLLLGMEALAAPWAAALIVSALLFVAQRGLIFGGILTILVTTTLAGGAGRLKKLRNVLILGVLLTVALMESNVLAYRLTDIFFERSIELVNIQDDSTSFRLGHFEGYFSILKDQPYVALIGGGPTKEIFNPLMGASIPLTEISILNTAIWFGIPYAVFFLLWLFGAAWELWKCRGWSDRRNEDVALLVGAVVFWLIGNTNPLMNTPFSVLALVLLRVRLAEIARPMSNQSIAR